MTKDVILINIIVYHGVIKGKYHVKIMLKDVFGFAEHQEKATYGVGYKTDSNKK